MNVKTLALAILAVMAVPAASAQDDAASALMTKFMRAWSANDAKAISDLFAPDADFVNPIGAHATGRAAIEAFYAAAFARGYAGSKGVGEVVNMRMLAPGIALIDGRFSISGAQREDGTARPPEKGILAAVLRKTGTGWQIEALRENEGASDIVPLR